MRFNELVTESVSNESVTAWAKTVRETLGLEEFSVWKVGAYLKLSMMKVPRDNRTSEVGTKAMQEFCRYADEHHLIGSLSPASKEAGIGTTSRSRLVSFYKRFGFVENKGRNKDFGTQDS